MSAKVYREGDGENAQDYLWFYCVGCQTNHRVPVTGPRKWNWNGSEEKPTLTPSIKVTWHKTTDAGTARVTDSNGNDVMHVCHSFVTEGRIQYLGDCTHELAGQTVDLEEMP
jgi:hypothetical protein